MANPIQEHSTDTRAGKYLTFELAGEAYGIEIIKVREIIGMMAITHVPRMPNYVLGVTNLRGKVIPVIDLRLKFNMEFAAQTPETCIIVVDVDGNQMGIKVDQVSEVLDIPGSDIEDPPTVDSSVDSSFITGMGKAKDRVNILLDIGHVITGPGMIDVAAITENMPEA
ncbi:chemotaxis protein CheW [bacterium]|nr:chemotaxis protein CheW [bacterium]MBU1637802.1 chemotaxis protein CheW [bacterium]